MTPGMGTEQNILDELGAWYASFEQKAPYHEAHERLPFESDDPVGPCPNCMSGTVENRDQKLFGDAAWACDTCGWKLGQDNPEWETSMPKTIMKLPGTGLPIMRHEPGSEDEGKAWRNPSAEKRRPMVRRFEDPKEVGHFPGFLPPDYPIRQGAQADWTQKAPESPQEPAWGAASPRVGEPADEAFWEPYKTAGMTLPQEQRAWQEIIEPLGHGSQAVHNFPNGYTVRRVSEGNDAAQIGSFMRNCWQGMYQHALDNSRLSGYTFHSLHDEHGLPRVAFYLRSYPNPRGDERRDERRELSNTLGARNNPPQPEHTEMLKQWADANGYGFPRYPYLTRHQAKTAGINHEPGEHGLHAKTAALTRSQLVAQQQQFNEAAGPDTAPIAHQFPDGWSIRKLTTPHAECYEGEMMGNCLGSLNSLVNHVAPEHWQEDSNLNDPPEEYYYHSVRDPQNIPHATFAHDTSDTDPSFWGLELEGRSGSNAAKYAPYVHDWWTAQGGPPVNPEAWEYEYGTPLTSVGTPEHQAEEADHFRPWRSRGFWSPEAEKDTREHFPDLVRAIRPMRQAWKQIENGADYDDVAEDLRQRLLHNYKPAYVEMFLKDLKHDHIEWRKYAPDAIKTVKRTEMPNFYWMHASYGPEVYQVIKQFQEIHRGTSWNHPSVWRSGLTQALVEQADLDPSNAERIADEWVSAHQSAAGWDKQSGLTQKMPCPECGGASANSRTQALLESQLTGRPFDSSGFVDCDTCRNHGYFDVSGEGAEAADGAWGAFQQDWTHEPQEWPGARHGAHGLTPCPDCGGDIKSTRQWDGREAYQCEGCRRTWEDTRTKGDPNSVVNVIPKGIDCPKCGSDMRFRDRASLGGLWPEGAWECSNQRCWHMMSPGDMVPDTFQDPDRSQSDLTIPEDWHQSAWRTVADYNGWTNWDTWHTALLMDNEQSLYNACRKLVERGGTVEQLRDWAIRKVLGPHNAQAIKDAQEWNEIPEDERLDHNYEDLKERNPEAADLVNGLGFGPDVSDTEPTLMDPELVNWQEIHDHLTGEAKENEAWEHSQQQARDMGLGWAVNGGDDRDKMRDAIYRFHGAVPDEEMGPGSKFNHPNAYHNIKVNLPFEHAQEIGDWPEQFISLDTRNAVSNHHFQKLIAPFEVKVRQKWPDLSPEETEKRAYNLMRHSIPQDERYEHKYDESDPQVKNLIYADPSVQDIMANGYQQRLHDFADTLLSNIELGKPHPYLSQMQQALQQRGYPPEQIEQMMRQKRRWDPETQKQIDLEPPAPKPPDLSLDQPGDLTLPEGWTASIQHMGSKLDWLKQRAQQGDKLLSTPQGQNLLNLFDHYTREHGDKVDPLLPWFAREVRKGRLHHEHNDGVRPGYVGHLYARQPGGWVNPDGTQSYERYALHGDRINHWADWYHSNAPNRRGVDIMQLDQKGMRDKIEEWNEYLREQQAKADQAQAAGGEVVHQFPDNWTVRKLGPEHLKFEGDAMGHCVGSGMGYEDAIRNGQSLIYSLRDPQHQPHATVEIEPRSIRDLEGNISDVDDETLQDVARNEELRHNPGGHYQGYEVVPHNGRVVQIQGKSNDVPNDEYANRLRQWFETIPEVDRPTGGGDNPYIANGPSFHRWLDSTSAASPRNRYGLEGEEEDPYVDDWGPILTDLGHELHTAPSYDPRIGKGIYDLAQDSHTISSLGHALDEANSNAVDNMSDWAYSNHPEYEQMQAQEPDEYQSPEYQAWEERREELENQMYEGYPVTAMHGHVYQLLEPHKNPEWMPSAWPGDVNRVRRYQQAPARPEDRPGP